MGKKIMIVCGSPRKEGNTNRLVAWVADAASEAGAEVEVVDAAHLNYKVNGCIACMGCQKKEGFGCVIEDDAQAVIARMPEADVLVMASPVYSRGPTAQLKLLIDRMFSLVKIGPHGPTRSAMQGMTLGLIGTAAGGMEDGLGLLEETFKMAATQMHLPFHSLLAPFAPWEPDEIESDAALKERATAFGRMLAGA